MIKRTNPTKNFITLILLFNIFFIQIGLAEKILPPTPTIYVDRDAIAGLSDGTSWANAFTDLQDALDVYVDEDVWVAEGTYKPSKDPSGNISTSSRDRTFFLPDGIKIYGGFDGTETAIAQRNILNHTTILSGDFNNDDNFDVSNGGYQGTTGSENAYHIVLAVTNASGIGVSVDGFSITGGNANNNGNIFVNGQNTLRSYGGGIYTINGTNTINNNTVYGNTANNGSGIHTTYGTNMLDNNTIHSNLATNFGGGICTLIGTNAISNNTIHSNSATNFEGGGIHIQGGTHTVNNNNIYSNSTLGGGGGIHIESVNTITLYNNTIHLNTAQIGAGINLETGSHILNNNIIHSNSATSTRGGGINIKSDLNLLNNNIFYANSANFYGGGIYIESNSNVLNNNILYANSANNSGGGIYVELGVNTFNNNTFYSNHSISPTGRGGGGLYNDTGTITLRNNIFWENKKGNNNNIAHADIRNSNGGTLNISHCITQENSDYSTGTGIFNNQNPLFVNSSDLDGADNIYGTADDGLALQDCSPAINTGTTTSPVSPTDILGNNRVGVYDMGAYENQTPGIVNANASLAMTNTNISMPQTAIAYYGNDCSSLIAKVEQSGSSTISGNVDAKVWFDASVMQMGQPYVQRHFEITPAVNASTSTGTVTLYFRQAEFDAFNADATSVLDLPTGPSDATGISNLKITKFSGTSNDGTGLPSTYNTVPSLIDPIDSDIVWNTMMSRWEVSFVVTGFSGFFAHTGSTSLPVELTYFQAEKKGNTSLLFWETASENNNRGFHVERSRNGSDFERIGWVKGMDSSTEIQEYDFVDKIPLNRINYYRLIQEDFDGSISSSSVRKVKFERKMTANLFPNPVESKSNLTLELDAQNRGVIHISIVNGMGKQLRTILFDLEKGINTIAIDTKNLVRGIYFLHLANNEALQTIKFSLAD